LPHKTPGHENISHQQKQENKTVINQICPHILQHLNHGLPLLSCVHTIQHQIIVVPFPLSVSLSLYQTPWKIQHHLSPFSPLRHSLKTAMARKESFQCLPP